MPKLHELELLAARAMIEAGIHPCRTGHIAWTFMGGANCGCEPNGNCSIPVYGCELCGDSDYGENKEASEIIVTCKELYPEFHETELADVG